MRDESLLEAENQGPWWLYPGDLTLEVYTFENKQA